MMMLRWREGLVGTLLLAPLFSGCGFKKAESPAVLALAKAKQLQSENSHILAKIELQKVLKEQPEHKEASYLALVSELELQLKPDSPEILAAAQRVLKLFPPDSAEAKKAGLVVTKAEIQGRLGELQDAFKRKDWKTVGELFQGIPEELEDADTARVSFLYHRKQGQAEKDSRAYRSLGRWLASSPGGSESDEAKEWKALVDLGMSGTSKSALENLFQKVKAQPSSPELRDTVKGPNAKEALKILERCQKLEVLDVKETERHLARRSSSPIKTLTSRRSKASPTRSS